MPLKDQIKNIGRKLVEDRPDREALPGFVLTRKPLSMMFSDDGLIPSNPRFPVLLYRGAINVAARRFKAATIMDAVFAENGWGRSWRDTVYDFVHYHSQVHEVLGVARGRAALEFGGPKGRVLTLNPGDVAVLPAGTGHHLINASRGFQVVGAYPEQGTYDECTDSRVRPEAIKRIAKVNKPSKDPIYGATGPMAQLWSTARKSR